MNSNQSNFIKPVTIEGANQILFQMSNCICKIRNNQRIGTGFFCKIPFNNNVKIKVLITSYEIINESYFNQNSQINLLMNDFNQLKVINIDPSRNIYFNSEYNTTIIELKDNDTINNYLELDDNLFSNDIKSLFESESIYILQYLKGGKAIVSNGILNDLNGFNIKHTCYINSGSNGAPILNLTNYKVIGLTLEERESQNYNKGIIMKFPIEDFINTYQIKNNQIPNMFNNNFQGMGINNNFLPNMIVMNQNNFIPNMMGMNNNVNNINDEWMKGFQMNPMIEEKIAITFKTTKGLAKTLYFNYGTTVDKMLETYLKSIARENLYKQKSKEICFIFNAHVISYGNLTPVEIFFNGCKSPSVIVNEVNNLIGGISLNEF